MKQYITLAGALIVVIVLNCIQVSFLKNTGADMLKSLDSISISIENEEFDEAKIKTDKLKEDWQNVKVRWDILTEHDDVEELESHLASIETYIKNEEKTDGQVEVAILKQRIDHIIQNETLSFATIF